VEEKKGVFSRLLMIDELVLHVGQLVLRYKLLDQGA